jgi:hypothetical protein
VGAGPVGLSTSAVAVGELSSLGGAARGKSSTLVGGWRGLKGLAPLTGKWLTPRYEARGGKDFPRRAERTGPVEQREFAP